MEPRGDCNSDADRIDGDICTADICNNGTCEYEKSFGCCTEDNDCDDGLVCTVGTCDIENNSCVFETPDPDCCDFDTDCDDGDACNIDRCLEISVDTDRIPATPIVVRRIQIALRESAGDGTCIECTTSFNPTCDDGNVCTADSCNFVTKKCLHQPISGCCQNTQDCNDGLVCTVDSCTLRPIHATT